MYFTDVLAKKNIEIDHLVGILTDLTTRTAELEALSMDSKARLRGNHLSDNPANPPW